VSRDQEALRRNERLSRRVQVRTDLGAGSHKPWRVQVFDDFDRIFDHLAEFGSNDTASRVADTVHTVQVLAHSPLIGRKVRGGKRELVVGQGVRGYVALYRYIADIDTVFILAIRSQREAGYKHGA
jgi:plasmid stabilization system protein ParE